MSINPVSRTIRQPLLCFFIVAIAASCTAKKTKEAAAALEPDPEQIALERFCTKFEESLGGMSVFDGEAELIEVYNRPASFIKNCRKWVTIAGFSMEIPMETYSARTSEPLIIQNETVFAPKSGAIEKSFPATKIFPSNLVLWAEAKFPKAILKNVKVSGDLVIFVVADQSAMIYLENIEAENLVIIGSAKDQIGIDYAGEVKFKRVYTAAGKNEQTQPVLLEYQVAGTKVFLSESEEFNSFQYVRYFTCRRLERQIKEYTKAIAKITTELSQESDQVKTLELQNQHYVLKLTLDELSQEKTQCGK